jgi:hypothetical protein
MTASNRSVPGFIFSRTHGGRGAGRQRYPTMPALLTIIAVIVGAVMLRPNPEDVFVKLSARLQTVPQQLEAIFGLVPNSKHIVVRDVAIHEQESPSALSIGELFFRNVFEDGRFTLRSEEYRLRCRVCRKTEASGNPFFGEKEIDSGGLFLGYRLARIFEHYLNANRGVWRPDFIALGTGGIANVGFFRIDEGSLANDQSIFSDEVQPDGHKGIDHREHGYYVSELFHGFPVAPETLLGFACWCFVPFFVARSIGRRRRFIWLVMGFVFAHVGAFLLGMYQMY